MEIRTAHAMGALSADEMTAALSRQRQMTLASIDEIKRRNRALAETPSLHGARGFETANLAAQFQDIGVTAAMGMSPLQIALQQGTQLSAVLSTMDKPVAGLAAAFASVLSPLSLVTIGTVAAGAAAIQYFASVGDGTKTVDEVLARHQENIDALGPAYQRALAEQRKYAAASVDVLNARLGDNAKDAQAALVAAAQEAYSAIAAAMQGSVFGSRGDDSMFRFDGAREALAAFLSSIEEGTPKVGAFEEEIRRLETASAISPEAAKELRNFIAEAVAAEAELSNVVGKVDPVAHAFSELQRRIDAVNPFNATGRLSELSGELDKLWRNMRAGRVDTTELGRELDRLRTVNPDMSDAIDEIERLGRAALATMQDVQSLANVTGSLGKTGRNSLEDRNSERGRDLDLFLRTDNDLRDKLKAQADEMERAANKAARAGASARNAYRDLIKSADDRIAQMALEAEMAGKVGVEAEALRFELDLLQRAEDKGRSITGAQRAAIAQRVEAFKEYAEAAATAKLQADLLWESEQAGRTWMDQQVAGRLRSAGLPVDFESYEAGLIRMNLSLQAARSYAGDFVDTLFDGLDRGEDLWDSMADAGIAALKRLGKSLVDDVLNNIFSIQRAASSGLGGGGGGIFGGGGFLNSIVGTLFSPQWRLASSGAVGLFDRGGYTGPGGIHEPRGIVHAGEVVWSQADVARAGGVGVVEAMRLGHPGYARGGAVDVQPMLPAGRSADQLNQASAATVAQLKVLVGLASDGKLNLRPEVEAVVDERAPGIAVEIVEQNNASLPDRVAEINQHPRWR
ncbi:phage tail length tape measure family protein [Shinella sp. BYT-45]|uniref:phage tail length tape measure family protein n=1 Tax=Shinella sp. BYT-45 TaxID=3377377 RepID=UPI00398016F2